LLPCGKAVLLTPCSVLTPAIQSYSRSVVLIW
jgi:hypothetical protein